MLAETRTSPRSVNFNAFEMKFRRICDIFPSSEYIAGNVTDIFENQIDRLVQQQRPQHAAQSGEQIGDLKFDRLGFHFAGFHFGQIQQIVHQFQQVLGAALRM